MGVLWFLSRIFFVFGVGFPWFLEWDFHGFKSRVSAVCGAAFYSSCSGIFIVLEQGFHVLWSRRVMVSEVRFPWLQEQGSRCFCSGVFRSKEPGFQGFRRKTPRFWLSVIRFDSIQQQGLKGPGTACKTSVITNKNFITGYLSRT